MTHKLKGFDPDKHLLFNEADFWEDEETSQDVSKDELQSGQLIWKFKIGDPIRGGITSVIDQNGNRRIYFGTTGRKLYALETDQEGFAPKMVWEKSLGGEIISTPIFKDFVIYITTKSGNIYAIDSGLFGKKHTPGKAINETPKIIWDAKLRKGINTQPMISSNMLLISSWDDHLHAYEAFYNTPDSYQIGKELWVFKAEGINSSPNLFEGTAYIGDDEGKMYAINYGGKSAETFWELQVSGGIWNKPYVDEDRVYLGTLDGYVIAIEAGLGKELWKYKTGDKIYSSPIAIPYEGGRKACIIGSDDGYLYSLVQTGGSVKPIWKIRTKGRVRATPVYHRGKIFIGSGDNNFYCIEASSGTILWRYATNGNVHSKAVVMKDKVLFGSTDGYLYCISI